MVVRSQRSTLLISATLKPQRAANHQQLVKSDFDCFLDSSEMSMQTVSLKYRMKYRMKMKLSSTIYVYKEYRDIKLGIKLNT